MNKKDKSMLLLALPALERQLNRIRDEKASGRGGRHMDNDCGYQLLEELGRHVGRWRKVIDRAMGHL